MPFKVHFLIIKTRKTVKEHTEMKKATRKILTATAVVAGLAVIASVTALGILKVRTNALRTDISVLYSDPRYTEPVYAEGIDVITQDVSCGYAVIEMFSGYCGKDITEESLYEEYGKVVTSTGNSFRDEMNRQFPEYSTEIHKYLTDSELIGEVYDSLAEGMPVPFEWAALYGDQWTLHYSIVIGMDIPGDTVTVANPYGYYEYLSLQEFLERTRYDAWENMPLFLKLGFAFGIFEKNTVFIVK